MDSGITRWAGRLFAIVSWIFVACVAIQVFFAGMGVFMSPANWGMHASFVSLFGFLPVAMVVLALVGRLPRRLLWISGGLFFLIGFQYMSALAMSGTAVAALHPVSALLIFWLGVYAASRSVSHVAGRQAVAA